MKKRTRIPLRRAELTIFGVTAIHVNDTERVGEYDFNRLRYDATRGLLIVDTNVPLELSARVRSVEVWVDASDDVIGHRAARYFPFGDARAGVTRLPSEQDLFDVEQAG